MIVSASRRTDIPAHYSDWFMNRIREGYVLATNPRNAGQVRRVMLAPGDVDGFVFWTKNPAPMRKHLAALSAYACYFQVTVTPYGADVEPGVPDKEKSVIPAVLRLSDAIGPHRVVWRYDPILLSAKYAKEFHYEAFDVMARRFAGCVRGCTISFLDMYKNTARNAAALGLNPLAPSDMLEVAGTVASIAKGYGMEVRACAEPMDFSGLGIARTKCVDPAILEEISGRPICAKPDKNQRPGCGCAASVDIGAYNTCPNGCKYCYANFSPALTGDCSRVDPGGASLTGRRTAPARNAENE